LNVKTFNMLQKTIISILLFGVCLSGNAQNLGFKFEGIGDNREFFSGHNKSETIFGSRLIIDASTTIDTHHTVKAGLSYFYEFGSQLFEQKPQPILFYDFQKGTWTIKMGSMPRNDVIEYPLAIISDVYGYYRATFEGLYLSHSSDRSKIAFWADWVSRQDTLRREQFMAGFTSKHQWGNLYAKSWLYLFHNANRIVRLPGESIEDNLGGLLLAGYDFAALVPLDILCIETGLLSSAYRKRGLGEGFSVKYSSYTRFEAAYKGYGLNATYHIGDPHYFEYGDLFYRNTKNYLRIGLYFTPIDQEKIKGRFTWSIHVAEGKLDNQQQFSLIYLFNR
jgi:hypothetical protein